MNAKRAVGNGVIDEKCPASIKRPAAVLICCNNNDPNARVPHAMLSSALPIVCGTSTSKYCSNDYYTYERDECIHEENNRKIIPFMVNICDNVNCNGDGDGFWHDVM